MRLQKRFFAFVVPLVLTGCAHSGQPETKQSENPSETRRERLHRQHQAKEDAPAVAEETTHDSDTASADGEDGTEGEDTSDNETVTVGEGGSVIVVRHNKVTVNGQVIVNAKTGQSVHGGKPVTHRIEKSVSAASVNTVEVRSDFGGITFLPTTDPAQIAIRADISLSDTRLSEADRKKYVARFTMQSEMSGGTLRIRSVPPADFPRRMGFGASFRVMVPPVAALDAETSNGAVTVTDTNTREAIHARSEFGSLTVTNAGTRIDAETSNGSISVSNRTPMTQVTAHSDFGAINIHGEAERIEARTSNGAVMVEGATKARRVEAHSDFGSIIVSDCGGAVEAVTSNGAVSYTGLPASLDCRSDFGAVTATLAANAAPSRATLITSNGSVVLNTSRSANLSIQAKTDNGSITANGVSGTTTGDGEKTFRGTLNGGKSTVRLQSDFGSITINAH